jgi:hypothetical protein
MEATVDIFKERLGKMDTTDLENNREKSEGIEVHQEVPKEEAVVEIIGTSENRSLDGEPVVGYRKPTEKADQL